MNEERTTALRNLEKFINYRFGDLERLNNALVHRSFINENPGEGLCDNERLEFLGDAVLGMCISDLIMERFPDFTEGKLSKLRSSIVSEPSLAEVACKLNIGDYLLLGKGEELTGGRKKPSLLADAFEAVVAAIYLDGGFKKVTKFIQRLFVAIIEAENKDILYKDYKTALQEETQGRFKEIPLYILSSESGPDHDKTFEISLSVAGMTTRGMGKSKKEAEQRAAKRALEELEKREEEV